MRNIDIVLHQVPSEDLEISKFYLQQISTEILEIAFGDFVDFETITTLDVEGVKENLRDWPSSLNDRRFLFAVFVYFDYLSTAFQHDKRRGEIVDLLDMDAIITRLAEMWKKVLRATKEVD